MVSDWKYILSVAQTAWLSLDQRKMYVFSQILEIYMLLTVNLAGSGKTILRLIISMFYEIELN